MIDDIARMKSKAAFECGLDSEEYRSLEQEWIEHLLLRGSHRPPVEMTITRNCIELHLQWVRGDVYKYVPAEKWVDDEWEFTPRPLREILVSEIRIASKALREALLIERGQMDAEEGVVDSDNSDL